MPSTAPGPNEFTIDNWKRALLAETLVDAGRKQESTPAAARVDQRRTPAEQEPTAGFACAGRLVPCAASVRRDRGPCRRCRNGASRLRDSQRDRDRRRHRQECLPGRKAACRHQARPCPARQRSDHLRASPRNRSVAMPDGIPAAIGDVEANDDAPVRIPAVIEYAIRQPYRPWHAQRRFSREARGLAPYRRPDATAPAGTAAGPTSRYWTAAPVAAETAPAQPASREPAADAPEPQ